MILITGSGRSGTSITAKLFKEAGYKLGDAVWVSSINAGLENKRAADINLVISRNGFAGHILSKTEVKDEVKKWRTDLYKLGGTVDVIKDPRMCYTLPVWTTAMLSSNVIICTRNIRDVVESVKRSGAGYIQSKSTEAITDEIWRRYETLMYYIAEYKIKFNIIRYEYFEKDAIRVLSPYIGKDIIEQLLATHFNPRK